MVITIMARGKRKGKTLLGAFFGAALLAGCSLVSTQKGFYEPITAELQAGRYEAVVQRIEAAYENGKYPSKDRFLYFLDAGLAYHYAGKSELSNQRLAAAEAAADELYTKSVSRAAASFFLNDNVLEYTGEDYEVLYTNLIQALNYAALDRFEDAFVEIKRANEKLGLLEQKYRDAAQAMNDGAVADTSQPRIEYQAAKVRFNNDALARYLSMHLYAAQGKMDDARIDYDLLVKAYREQPHIYPFTPPEVRYHSPKRAVLSLVALVGLSPVKEGLTLRLRTDKDLDLVQILYTDPGREGQEYGHLPLPISEDYYFKFAIPQIVSRPSRIQGVRVKIDTLTLGELQLIEDIDLVARETFEAKKSLIYLRSIGRALVKGLAGHEMKKKADTGGAGGWLKKLAIDVASDIIENADLRCSRLLPGRVLVGDFEVDPGTYDVTFELLGSDGGVISIARIENYQVLQRGLNLVHAVAPL